MLSNRTGNFFTNEKEEDKDFVKLLTAPFPKFDMNFHFQDEEEEEENEASSFSFKNNLLSKNAYDFIKKKDECLAAMVLDDTIPSKN